MTKYKNTKTGAIFSTSCSVSGGDWVKISTKNDKNKQKESTIKDKTKDNENE